jgi:predicted Zn-ribbon and HTH transcriptional regulator
MRILNASAKITRVTFTRRELLFIKSFIENVAPGTETDRLLDKLEIAIARIDGTKIGRRKANGILLSEPDQCRARCRACGWNGTLTKTAPCPACGQKVNPLLFNGRKT